MQVPVRGPVERMPQIDLADAGGDADGVAVEVAGHVRGVVGDAGGAAHLEEGLAFELCESLSGSCQGR